MNTACFPSTRSERMQHADWGLYFTACGELAFDDYIAVERKACFPRAFIHSPN